MNTKEDLLGNFLRFRSEAGAKNGDRHAEHRIAITSNQLCERPLVTPLAARRDKGLVTSPWRTRGCQPVRSPARK